jgi:hypothetical protein
MAQGCGGFDDAEVEAMKDFGPNRGLSKRVSGAYACHLCAANEFEPCEHIHSDDFTETTRTLFAARAARAATSHAYTGEIDALRSVMAELKEHGLLEQAQIIKVDTISIQLGPKPFAPPVLTEQQEAKQDAERHEPLNLEEMQFQASEGGFA